MRHKLRPKRRRSGTNAVRYRERAATSRALPPCALAFRPLTSVGSQVSHITDAIAALRNIMKLATVAQYYYYTRSRSSTAR